MTTTNAGFLDWVREARLHEGRGNDEILRAMLPLMRQVVAVHDAGRVAPLDGIGRIYAAEGGLWFHADEAVAPTIDRRALRDLRASAGDGLEIVGKDTITLDLDAGLHTSTTQDVQEPGAPVLRPVYLPGYTTWEHEIGHHDALTDVLSLGMMLASVALGLDFTERDELRAFVGSRHGLSRLHPTLHPVIARAIVRMTEVDRHRRAQDLAGIVDRLERYREVDDRADREVDFRQIEGFVQADRSSRRKIVQAHLQGRLFDVSRRNRLIWFQPTQQMLDLTIASVPLQLAVDHIRPEELFLWDGPGGADVLAGRPLNLDKYVRFEEAPWVRGVLDHIRADDARQQAELGFSELKLVVAFLNWHNLKEARDERIRSPLLLLPVTLARKRGVRDSYLLQATSEIAEVNPVLRHYLHQVYGLELPEQVDLRQTDLATLHKAITAEITRSEPGIAVHLLTRPQIRLATERARRRLDAWRRRSSASGRGLSRHEDVDFSYTPSNFHPLGQQLFQQLVKPEELLLEQHAATANVVVAAPVGEDDPEEAREEGVIETSRSVYTHTEEASGPMDWAVDLTHCTLGNFSYRKMSLVRDYARMLEEPDGDEHPAFDALFSPDAREIEAPPAPGGDPFEPFAVVPADPTQTAAIRWARTGRDFIIQGPPGTGKSQTITNLISDFAARGKRVLFVCQKRAALDVVYHRLAEHGLDELSVIIHDSQADKKPFLDDLRATYEAWSRPTEPSPAGTAEQRRQALLGRMKESIDAISRFSQGMTGPVADGGSTVAEVLAQRLSAASPPELTPEMQEKLPTHGDWAQHREIVHAAARALADAGESTVLSKVPLRHLGRPVLEAAQPVAALKAGLDRLETTLARVRAAGALLGTPTAAELAEALALATEVAPLVERGQIALLDRDSPASTALQAFIVRLKAARRQLEKLQAETAGWTEKLPRSEMASALASARGFEALFFLFRWLSPAWWRLRGVLQARYAFAKHVVAPTWTAILEGLAAEYAQLDAISGVEEEARDALSIQGSVEELVALVGRVRVDEGRTPRQIALRTQWSRDPSAVRALLDARSAIEDLARQADQVFDGGSAWGVDELAERVAEARAAADLLPDLAAPLRALLDASPVVRDAVRSIPMAASHWDGAVAQASIERTWRADRTLARFDHLALSRRQAQVRATYDGWLDLNAEAVREGVRARFVAGLRVCGIPAAQLTAAEKGLKKTYNAGRKVLEREFEKVVRHHSIRELTQGDTGSVIYDLKPIWLMSPLSISDTIPLHEQRFDVVIFDEASQIPLEEAVPAVYRAPQMIVVGDEMQLPPTSFFASAGTDDAPDDPDDVRYDLDADSFLTHSARRLPSTMLGWHYRSRSETLIRFSNQAFYAGRLRTIPDRTLAIERGPIRATADQGEANAPLVLDRPISFHRLDGAVYAARKNAAEARYIAGLVRGLLASGLTIGIVAFSEAQQSEIEAALERLAGEDPDFRRALDAEVEREDDGQLVGLFVKNLENVQGDERDVIVLSICYAPDAQGRMVMNFGPINKGGGEKRLNVVFSRAKRHMAVVSSIDHTAITNLHNDGASCFRRYLQYADAASRGDMVTAANVMRALAAGEGSGATRTPGALVATLQEALEGRGWEVEPGIGSSGFVVDLAVRDPGADAFTVAVLVDGAEVYAHPDVFETWHLRPTLLRMFGWRVVHVLAKDWLADSEACLGRIEAVLRGEWVEEELPEEPVVVVAPAPVADAAPADAPAPPRSGLAGRSVLITGALQSMSRLEAEGAIRDAGGRVARAAAKGVDFALIGDRPGSKLAAVKQLGIPIIDEAAFQAMLSERAGREAER